MRGPMLLSALLLVGCSPGEDPFTFAEPGDAPPLRGPGGPTVSFSEGELFEPCALVPGGPGDKLYRNLVMPYRGHMVMPWAAEWGEGGLTFLEMDDPCHPVAVGHGYEITMRETHAIGFVHLPPGDPNAGDWALVPRNTGLVFWDISDPQAPEVASLVQLENVFWPDAYTRVVLSQFWQYPYLYVAAADNGLFILDATDPRNPEVVGRYSLDPLLRLTGVFVLGNRMLLAGSETSESAMLDISDPLSPQLYPGGRFEKVDQDGTPRRAYHANMVGPYGLFTRKHQGSGPIVMDLSDPSNVAFVGDHHEPAGSGGYIFYHEGFLFQGESNFGNIYDARDPSDITLLATLHMAGDFDTLTPWGNVAIGAVDEGAQDGEGSLVFPWRTDPDTTPPEVLLVDPPDGATGVPLTARIGVGFNELLEPSTVFAGSIRLWDEDGRAIDGWGSAQETIASYVPKEPLQPGTTYTVEVMAGGITDLSGNALAATVTTTFTTAGE